MDRKDRNLKKNSGGKSAARKRKVNTRKLILFVIIFAAVAYFAYFAIWQQISISKKNKEIEALKESVSEATAQSEQLKQELDNLNDPEYIEKIARERLGLVRPNERVFVDSNKSEDNTN